MAQQIAKLNNLRIAPRKMRLLADLIRGLSSQEAEAQLLFKNRRAAKILLKLLHSAIANARNKKMNIDQLIIKNITVNQGPTLKRWLPRAMGRATPIHKKTSHITLLLEESPAKLFNRFTIIPPPKKIKKQKTKIKEPKPKSEIKEKKPKEKVGFFKRFFRRKSV